MGDSIFACVDDPNTQPFSPTSFVVLKTWGQKGTKPEAPFARRLLGAHAELGAGAHHRGAGLQGLFGSPLGAVATVGFLDFWLPSLVGFGLKKDEVININIAKIPKSTCLEDCAFLWFATTCVALTRGTESSH